MFFGFTQIEISSFLCSSSFETLSWLNMAAWTFEQTMRLVWYEWTKSETLKVVSVMRFFWLGVRDSMCLTQISLVEDMIIHYDRFYTHASVTSVNYILFFLLSNRFFSHNVLCKVTQIRLMSPGHYLWHPPNQCISFFTWPLVFWLTSHLTQNTSLL